MSNTKIIIVVEGGVIQNVIHNDVHIDVSIIDLDTHSLDFTDNLKELYLLDKLRRVYLYPGNLGVFDPVAVESLEFQIKGVSCDKLFSLTVRNDGLVQHNLSKKTIDRESLTNFLQEYSPVQQRFGSDDVPKYLDLMEIGKNRNFSPGHRCMDTIVERLK